MSNAAGSPGTEHNGVPSYPVLSEGFGITKITMTLVRPGASNTLKAMASIQIGGHFQIDGLRIVNGRNGLFVGFPQRLPKEGEQKREDIAFPITADARAYLTSLLL